MNGDKLHIAIAGAGIAVCLIYASSENALLINGARGSVLLCCCSKDLSLALYTSYGPVTYQNPAR
jgi:hypothetical protein